MDNFVNDEGYFGAYGGAFIPEILHPNVKHLQNNYLQIINSEDFKTELKDLLKNYVGRPSPLYHAKRLSELYKTNIYLKREDLNHTGSHKINNALGQILLAKKLGKTRIIAETGAGQHGVATATAAALFGMKCIVYMGEIDMQRQAPNVKRMQMLGTEVIPALSGSKTLKDAINEAMRDWINNSKDTYYLIGSVMGPHPYPDLVGRLQAIISEELLTQVEEETGKAYPDYIIACVGGGSNATGVFYHFINNDKVKLICAEAAGQGIESGFSAATTHLGSVGILHGFKTIIMQTKDGQIEETHSISAGLDYPGIGPLLADLKDKNKCSFIPITDEEAIKAGFLLSQKEGIIPALESAHALAILDKMQFNIDENIIINISGRGDKDLETYFKYL
ncbi:MAG: tryptophan synthase subunit beta [Bacteroidetes bacterium GWF2_29_10]|nr:MAG: tryptophan synthase subunit beta [Bacteroidetes bacterium GWF2_29_10]